VYPWFGEIDNHAGGGVPLGGGSGRTVVDAGPVLKGARKSAGRGSNGGNRWPLPVGP